jgi:hypothetical protein
MDALKPVLIVLGMLLVAASLSDVFQSVIVPRAPRRLRLSRYVTFWGWQLWPRAGWKLYARNEQAREDFLATFAPLALIALLVMWSFSMLVGYGAIFFALRDDIRPHLTSFGQAVYFAGTSFFTIGFGDFVGTNGWTRFTSVAAGASGFAIISSMTAALFSIFGAFQMREQFVVVLGARAGSPPSGVGLLALAAGGDEHGMLSAFLRDGQRWCALVMETHLAYPILAFFRSSHDYESWVGALGTLLDAATIMLTTIECNASEAQILYNIGRHAVHDLADFFEIPAASGGAGIERDEFERACLRLESAGYRLHDRAAAWERFSALRGAYASRLNAIARSLAIPPLEWIGDRSLITAPHMRAQQA